MIFITSWYISNKTNNEDSILQFVVEETSRLIRKYFEHFPVYPNEEARQLNFQNEVRKRLKDNGSQIY